MQIASLSRLLADARVSSRAEVNTTEATEATEALDATVGVSTVEEIR